MCDALKGRAEEGEEASCLLAWKKKRRQGYYLKGRRRLEEVIEERQGRRLEGRKEEKSLCSLEEQGHLHVTCNGMKL